MLLFSTLLEINDTMTKDSFIQLVLEWNQGSPHEENIIQGIEWNGERNVRYGTETLWLAIEEYRNENIIAVRYEKTEADGVVWDTDYVMNFNDMRMSIQLDRSYLEEALAVDPTFSTPHFITLLIEHGYLTDDGILPMLRKPIFIKADNVDLLTDVINGTSRYRLPVVYISKTCYGEDPVDIWKLSGRLKGVAHVLVEEGTWLNGRIRRQCDNKNEFNGAIGVYFPNSAYGHKKYLYRAYDALEQALPNYASGTRRRAVLEDIIKSNNCKRRANDRSEQLKNSLRGYKTMSGSMKRTLQDMGFVIIEEGKHYKFIYYGDGRYMATLAKTPSDNRSGMNIALEIIKDMF